MMDRINMRVSFGRSVLFSSLLLVVLAVCTADQEGTLVTSEGGIVTSDDGVLTLEVPAGALATDAWISIRRIEPSELPEELSQWSAVGPYELLPDGQIFNRPVQLTVSLPFDAVQDDELDNEFFSMSLFLEDSRGVLESLTPDSEEESDTDEEIQQGMVIDISDETVTVQGETTHFSKLWVLNSDVSVMLDPANPSSYVTRNFFAETGIVSRLESDSRNRYSLNVDKLRIRSLSSGVSFGSTYDFDPEKVSNDFYELFQNRSLRTFKSLTGVCNTEGEHPFAATWYYYVNYLHTNPPGNIVYNRDRIDGRVTVRGRATCKTGLEKRTCADVLDRECINDGDCLSNKACAPFPSCFCMCSIERGARCIGRGDCVAERGEVCDFRNCECSCSRRAGAECDDQGGCSAPKSCRSSKCECVCDQAQGAECEDNRDCTSDQACNLESCRCGEPTEPEDCENGEDDDGDGVTDCDDPDCSDEPNCTEPPTEFEWTEDELGRFLDSISSAIARFTATYIDIANHAARRQFMEAVEAAEWFNWSVVECDTTSEIGTVVCPSGVQDMPEGELLAVAMQLVEDVPLSDSGHSLIYSLVLESDGNAANDWVYHDPYDWDLFQGTDRWYQLIWDHISGEWQVTTTQVDDSQNTSSVSSTIRVVINGDRIIFYLSMSELSTDTPGYRVTAFGHDGYYSPEDRGADVSGENPTESLTSL